MYHPDSYATALAFMIVTMIAWGSWANTQKLVPHFPFQLYYWDYVAGMLGFMVIAGLVMGSGPLLHDLASARPSAFLYALAGGAVFNIANLLLVATIAISGLAVAFPVGIGLALVVGVALNYAIEPKGHPVLLFAGVALVLAAIVVDALAYRLRGDAEKRETGRGLRLALLCGVLMGLFYPLVAHAHAGADGLNGYSVGIVFALGVLLCALPVNAFLMRRPLTNEPPTSFGAYRAASPGTHGCGVLGGMIWGCGFLLSILAADSALIGPAVSYAIGQGATMVSAGWGVFVWREFSGAPRASRMLLAPMFVLFLVGLIMVAAAPLYGR